MEKNFYEWLLNFEEVDQPIGDLVKDINRQHNFRKNTSNQEIFQKLDSAIPFNSPAHRTLENAKIYFLLETGELHAEDIL